MRALIVQDARHALRALWRTPTYTTVAVLTLALGIAVSVAMFTVMQSILWRALPYEAPQELVVIEAALGGASAGLSGLEAHELLTRTNVFTQLSLVTGIDAHVEIDGEVERVAGVSSSTGLLQTLGLRPALGRLFDARDAVPEGAIQGRSIIISNRLWRRRFGADPAAVGRFVNVNNIQSELVGVMPPGALMFLPGTSVVQEETDVWMPSPVRAADIYRGNTAVGRLSRGVTLIRVQQELDSTARQLVSDFPAAYRMGQPVLHVRGLHEAVVAGVDDRLRALALAVAFVLLVSCANVANLTVARASGRARDMAVRRALGAGRGRLTRQLLAESLVLSLVAGALGILLAQLAIRSIARFGPTTLPRLSEVGMDGRVVIFAVGVSVVAGVLVGILPALRRSLDNASSLSGGRTQSAPPSTRRLQRGLAIAELAFSIVPLVAAGMMLHSLVNLQRTPLGFDPSGVVTARMPVAIRSFADVDARWRLHQDVLDRLRAYPGVDAASAVSPVPFFEEVFTRRYGRVDAGKPVAPAAVQSAMPGYLSIVGTRLLAGRDFVDDDVRLKRHVVIIDSRIANELWPENAVGQRLALAPWPMAPLEIVGVVQTTRVTDLRGERLPSVFLPYHEFPVEMTLTLKTRIPASTLAPVIRRAAMEAGTGRAVFDIWPLQQYVDQSMAGTRFVMLLLVGFAAAALVLAGIGLYGALDYLSAQRAREFALRLALGATRRQIVSEVTREALRLASVGVALGLLAASIAGRGLQSLVYGVGPLDWPTLAAAAIVASGIALAASARPAWSASRSDMTAALRSD